MSLIIAGERSGVGKTTVTLAILAFLAEKGLKVQSFKVGPDYIDPMFHSAITARPCRNLDPILTSPTYIESSFTRHSQDTDYSLIEGVMGLYDGVESEKLGAIADVCPSYYASTAHIARILNLPILLVIDCSHLSGSVAAIVHGYRTLDPQLNLAGVILNRVGSDRHLSLLKEALEPLNVEILGVLKRQEKITIPDRHLGLIPTAELPQIQDIFKKLAHLAAHCFNWDTLFPLLKNKVIAKGYSLTENQKSIEPLKEDKNKTLKIAVAQDAAFSFYYADNLDILQELGLELIPWSPITDKNLPPDIQGIYFGGGFPEIFAPQLAENQTMRESVRQAIISGIPTYAECGGLMYLCEHLTDLQKKTWPMVGILPTSTIMDKKLTLGYRQATALENSLFLKQGEIIWGHEFHRSRQITDSASPLYTLKGLSSQTQMYREGWNIYNLHASYLHLHFGGYPILGQKFRERCLDFSQKLS